MTAPSGSDITWGSGNCDQGQVCQVDINDTSFDEIFVAQTRARYEFVKWQAGSEYSCGDSTDPTRNVFTVALAGSQAAESFLATSTIGRIQPIFRAVQRMVTGVVSVGSPQFQFASDENFTATSDFVGRGGLTRVTFPDYTIDCSKKMSMPVVTPVTLAGIGVPFYTVGVPVAYVAVVAGGHFRVGYSFSGTNTLGSFSFEFVDPMYP